ncbi:MAG: hypothetical protein IKK18_00635 [Clostridia bacterium]|nr:hypothetical protein [Clostridia bacterium]
MIYKLFDLYYSIDFNYQFSEKLLEPYRVCDDVPVCEEIKITKEEIGHETVHDTAHDEAYHEFVCIFRHISSSIIKYDGLFVHSAVIKLDNDGYMFSGKSGVGKSTHINEWVKFFGKDRVEIINGDKPIIRFFEDGIYAYGNPWCGVEGWSTNKKVRLKSVCFLKQSDENYIRKLKSPEILNKMINQTVIPENTEDKLKYFELLDKFLKALDFYELECDISENAVLTAYNTMRGE